MGFSLVEMSDAGALGRGLAAFRQLSTLGTTGKIDNAAPARRWGCSILSWPKLLV
jgi:hypothetical protein